MESLRQTSAISVSYDNEAVVSSILVDTIQLINGKAVIGAECRGCGRCVDVCPEGAIELTVDNNSYVEDSIESIDSIIDVE